MAGSVRRVMAVLFIVLVAAGFPQLLVGVGAETGGASGRLVVGVRVAVVVFDSSGMLNASSLAFYASLYLPPVVGDVFRGSLLGSVGVEYNVSFEGFQAPAWAVERLAQGLGGLYEPVGEPGWLGGSGCGAPGGYARVSLVNAYHVVYNATVSVLESMGVDPHVYTDVVAVLGDIDGVARVYHASAGGRLVLEGVRGWGSMTPGQPPLTFYDLAAPVKPWPGEGLPYSGRGVPAGPERDPCIWSLGDPEGYAARLVAWHAVFHVAGDLIGEASPLASVNASIVLVALPGAEGEARELAASFDAGAFAGMARMLAPWLDVDVSVRVVPAPEALEELYNESLEGGVAALDAGEAAEALGDLLPPPSPCLLECNWTLAVVVAPGPAHLAVEGVGGATGLLLSPNRAIAVYPGLAGRLEEAGLPWLAAHELGHALGEGHPFQYRGVVYWIMDEQSTPMSYMHQGQAAYGPLYAYTAQRLALAYAALLAQATGDPQAWRAVEEAARHYTLDSALQALATALEAARGAGLKPPTPQQPTTTPTATATRQTTTPATPASPETSREAGQATTTPTPTGEPATASASTQQAATARPGHTTGPEEAPPASPPDTAAPGRLPGHAPPHGSGPVGLLVLAALAAVAALVAWRRLGAR